MRQRMTLVGEGALGVFGLGYAYGGAFLGIWLGYMVGGDTGAYLGIATWLAGLAVLVTASLVMEDGPRHIAGKLADNAPVLAAWAVIAFAVFWFSR